MTARDAILAAVRRNLPRPAVPLPPVPEPGGTEAGTGLGYRDRLTRLPEVPDPADAGGESLLARFRRQLQAMGGTSAEVADAAAARAKVAELFPAARVVCSAAAEVPGTRPVRDVHDPHELHDVDLGVVRSSLGVAEAGALWLTQDDLVVDALGCLAQHLVVLLDPGAVVETMHEAYARIELTASPYGVFLAGPSATGDIEGVIIHGAQGARSLTVLLLAPPAVSPERTAGASEQTPR